MQRFLGMGVADVAKAAGVEWGKLTDKSVNFYFYFDDLKRQTTPKIFISLSFNLSNNRLVQISN